MPPAADHAHKSGRSMFKTTCLRWTWLGGIAIGCSMTLMAGAAATAPSESDPVTEERLKSYEALGPVIKQNAAELRETLSPEVYKALAAHLRDAYSQPSENWPAPTLGKGVEHVELARVPNLVHPEENPFTEAKAELGKMLFFDPRLSGSRQIACASCHEPDLDWADGRTVSFGHLRTSLKRNSPSLLNVGHASSLFWDGRARTLEDQALEVISNPDEMNADAAKVVALLQSNRQYAQHFKDAFGDEPISPMLMAKALATFQRTLQSTGRSDFDKFLAGDRDKLSDSAIRGLHLFRTAAGCINCHNGPVLSDGKFHNLGLSYYGRKLQDLGRYEITGEPADVGSFKTPSLRNVTRTGPYMHLGLFQLDGVLNMYNAGMATLRRKPEQADDKLFPTKSHLLRPLGLNKQDLADLHAFLDSLEEPRRRIRPPALPAFVAQPAAND